MSCPLPQSLYLDGFLLPHRNVGDDGVNQALTLGQHDCQGRKIGLAHEARELRLSFAQLAVGLWVHKCKHLHVKGLPPLHLYGKFLVKEQGVLAAHLERTRAVGNVGSVNNDARQLEQVVQRADACARGALGTTGHADKAVCPALVDDMGASPAVAAVAEVREEAERSAEEEDNNSMADMISGAMLPSSLRSSLSMSP